MTTKVERSDVLKAYQAILPGKNLYDLAESYAISPMLNGVLNKGWVGQLLEKVAGLEGSNRPEKDGHDFELKSTTLVRKGRGWDPRETIKITQMNPSKMLEESFENSVLWNKLRRLIIVGCEHPSPEQCFAVSFSGVDVLDGSVRNEIEAFWNDVKNIILEGTIFEFKNFGSSEGLIQLRPVGRSTFSSIDPITGKKFPSRAFYATKRLLRILMPLDV